jgi:hypothetical protein
VASLTLSPTSERIVSKMRIEVSDEILTVGGVLDGLHYEGSCG